MNLGWGEHRLGKRKNRFNRGSDTEAQAAAQTKGK
jgi:hypothetical protein